MLLSNRFSDLLMCVAPIKIKNPNYRRNPSKGLAYLKDCSNLYIYVPCGVCAECVKTRQMSLVQRFQMESVSHHFFFATLTYKTSCLPVLNVNGYRIRYGDVSHVQLMMKRLRKSNFLGRPFRYFAVSEMGGLKGRPHFHILFIIPKYKGDDYNTMLTLEQQYFWPLFNEWRVNSGSRRNPVWTLLSDYKSSIQDGVLHRTYDFHYVNPSLTDDGTDNVSWYVLKYMIKPSDRARKLYSALKLNLPHEKFFEVWSKVRPRYFKSLNFGQKSNPEVRKYLADCVRRSLASGSPYPCFIVPFNGQSFPLSQYYKSCPDVFTLEQANEIWIARSDDDLPFDSSYELDESDLKNRYYQAILSARKLERSLDSRFQEDQIFDLLFSDLEEK